MTPRRATLGFTAPVMRVTPTHTAVEGIYRVPTLHPPSVPRDPRVIRGVALGTVAFLLALASLWTVVVTGLFARPSPLTLLPAVPSLGCAVASLVLARGVWQRGSRRVLAGVVTVLGCVSFLMATLATVAYVTGKDPPPVQPMQLPPLFRC